MKALRSFVLLLVLLSTGSLFLYRHTHFTRAQTTAGSNAPCCGQDAAPHEIDFAYYSLRESFNSALLLVSASPTPMNFTVAVRSLIGETVLAPMSIQPQEKLSVDLRTLLAAQNADVNGAFAEGSVAVYFPSRSLASITLLSSY